MGDTGIHKVLQRKARSGRDEHQARVMSPARALRLALARAADDLFDLALSVSGVHAEIVAQDPLLSMLDDERLILVLDGPEGRLGAAAVDMQILSGLIEMQTMGKVIGKRSEARTPTQTDAAMFAPLLDATLQGLAENLSGEEGFGWVSGYCFGARIESARMMGLLLEAPDFHCFRLQVEIGEGAKQGEMLLALPVYEELPAQGGDRAGAGRGKDDPVEEAHLLLGQGALMGAEARLDAVLHRLRMPLSELARLKPGDVLNIPREALSQTRLEVGKLRPIGKCRLGQINGFRAVRMIPAQPARSAPQTDTAGEPAEAPRGRPKLAASGLPPAPPVSGDQGGALIESAALTGQGTDQLMAGNGLDDLPDLSDLPELAMGDLMAGG